MSILDKIKLGSTKVKTPWYKMYNNIPKHINYPKGSLYDIIQHIHIIKKIKVMHLL